MAEPLRVVLTTGNYNYIKDGVSLTLNRLVGWLERNGVEVLVIAPVAEEPAMEHEGRLLPVPSFAIPTRKEYRIGRRLTTQLKDEIVRFKPDLFHIAVPDITGHSALRLAEQMRVPVVSSFHTRFDGYLQYYRLGLLEPWFHKKLRAFYARCEHLYVPSASMMDELAGQGIADNMRLWTRGVDHHRFNPGKRSQDWRRAHGIADDELVIAYAGRLVAEKNMAVMARVFAGLKARGVAHRTILLGDGPEAGWMRKALPDTIFAGFLHGDELATGYASSDIFFFPSITETFGNVTLEAMASGLASVTADATGSRSLVRESETGFLVSVDREDQMIERLLQLLRDGRMRKEFGARAREIAMSEHEWDGIFARLRSDYGDAINGYASRKHQM
ncbi:glycosyltransferase family 4 protein [Anderseniella sp. Alg231-50]|uniref:glycosyltransferase family 4 protein n=1 Tax=Anderseniella sp. Alg231-50 TaxID=1922226 RepID=UPI00307BE7E3